MKCNVKFTITRDGEMRCLTDSLVACYSFFVKGDNIDDCLHKAWEKIPFSCEKNDLWISEIMQRVVK